ncbi:MAG: N-acetylmuramoyl-L-alanine amidase [Proteobacteria bacterium]|nr:N-acetylmuramoyl-L-alanine amidase [Pseudomonadota bacterium]
MSNTKLVIDAGHAGVAFGHYLQAGKQSPQVPPGIYEGEFNRQIARGIFYRSTLPTEMLNPGPVPISLKYRVNYVNKLHKEEPGLILLSIHANAASNSGWQTRRKGAVIFTAKNASKKSLSIAHRIDNRLDIQSQVSQYGIWESITKRENFRMINKTTCPAVLIECGFMDNKTDVERLTSKDGQEALITAIVEAIEPP